MLKDLTGIELDQTLVNSSNLHDFYIPGALKESLNKALGDGEYIINDYTSYAITDKKSHNTAIFPNQYFHFATLVFDLAIELKKYIDVFEELRSSKNLLLGTSTQIKSHFDSKKLVSNIITDPTSIQLFCDFLDKDNSKARLGAKDFVSKVGTPRPPKDCFSSVILASINMPNASSSIFGDLVYDLARSDVVFRELLEHSNKEPSAAQSPTEHSLNTSSLSDLSKPFILLAGISGTGKTRFIRDQADRSAVVFGLKKGENYCLVPVRPDWHEPSDLLGYISRLNGVQYVATDFLKFVFKAFCAAVESITNHTITWKKTDTVAPYWLCLDEMNLAPVEQYFSDYLSIIETRKWEGNKYHSEPLLKKHVFDDLNENSLSSSAGVGSNSVSESSANYIHIGLNNFFNGIFADISVEPELKTEITNYVKEKGLPLPPNLIVAGTVNMDETTHGFSRKVIDRALTFDFGEFFPNDFDSYFEDKTLTKLLSYPTLSNTNKAALQSVSADSDGELSIQFLKSVNDVLKGSPFELAFRALNELLLSVASFSPRNEVELQAVWDDFLMCKVLPRIDGDHDKLVSVNTNKENILSQLESKLSTSLSDIWDGKKRPDLLRESITDKAPILIPCRTKEKLDRMKAKLEKNTFTSFWP